MTSSDEVRFGVARVFGVSYLVEVSHASPEKPENNNPKIPFRWNQLIKIFKFCRGGGFNIFFMFTLIPGEMIQFDGCIFFSWVGEKPPVLGSQSTLGGPLFGGDFVFLGSFTGFTYTSYALMAQEKDLRLCCTVLVV